MTDGSLPAEILNLLACPVCTGRLVVASQPSTQLRCTGCARRFPIVDGIPILLADRALPEHGA